MNIAATAELTAARLQETPAGFGFSDFLGSALASGANPVTPIDFNVVFNYFNAFRFVFTVWALAVVFTRKVNPHQSNYWKRIILLALFAFVLALSDGMVLNGVIVDPKNVNFVLLFTKIWIPGVFVFALLAIKICYRLTWQSAIFRWLLGLCVERFITAFVHDWLFLAIVPEFRSVHPLSYLEICVFVYALFIGLSMWLLAPLFKHKMARPTKGKPLLYLAYLVSYLALTIASYMSMDVSELRVPRLQRRLHGMTPDISNILYFSTGVAGLVAVVIFLFLYVLYDMTTLQSETSMLNMLYRQKSKQYQALSESMKFINRKTHDLKHQMEAMEFSTPEQRSKLADQTLQAVKDYDAGIHTGNEALDTLLTERSFFCSQHGIRLSCMVGGCDFGAIDVVDLFTMLGNALDNAIGYVQKLNQPDKRVISVSARQKGNVITVSVDNYFEDGLLQLKDGLPMTTKTDTSSHGIGLKSIRDIARRYNGDIYINTADNTFTLRICLVVATESGQPHHQSRTRGERGLTD